MLPILYWSVHDRLSSGMPCCAACARPLLVDKRLMGCLPACTCKVCFQTEPPLAVWLMLRHDVGPMEPGTTTVQPPHALQCRWTLNHRTINPELSRQLPPVCLCADRGASKLFFTWLRGLARLCTYVSSLLSVISGALSFTVSSKLCSVVSSSW